MASYRGVRSRLVCPCHVKDLCFLSEARIASAAHADDEELRVCVLGRDSKSCFFIASGKYTNVCLR